MCFSQQRRLTLAPTIHSWAPPPTSPSPPLPPASQAGTNAHTDTHTYTHGSHIPTRFCKKSHVTYSSIYIVLCVRFYACTIMCTQLLYHTRSHSALRFLTAGGGEAQLTRPPGRAAVHTPEAQAGSKDSYFPGVVSPRNLPPGLSH